MTDTVSFARAVGPASAAEAHRLRHEARSWLEGLDMEPDGRDRVLAAVSEAVENAVEHAYPIGSDGTVELTLWVEQDAVNVQVCDHGQWDGQAADPAPPGAEVRRGRGIVLMHRSVDSVAIRHDGEGTVVALRHHRGDQPP